MPTGPSQRSAPSLNGRVFRDVTADHQGDVGGDTRFHYFEETDGVIHAGYEGGAVRLGFLVGTRVGDELDFRYSHVTVDGDSAAGRCRSEIGVSEDGCVVLRERWEWTSRPGEGTSTLEEIVSTI